MENTAQAACRHIFISILKRDKSSNYNHKCSIGDAQTSPRIRNPAPRCPFGDQAPIRPSTRPTRYPFRPSNNFCSPRRCLRPRHARPFASHRPTSFAPLCRHPNSYRSRRDPPFLASICPPEDAVPSSPRGERSRCVPGPVGLLAPSFGRGSQPLEPGRGMESGNYVDTSGECG
jgi:hypothetical protein